MSTPHPNTEKSNAPLICPVEAECGACQFLKLPYTEQLALKQEKIEKLFEPFIGDHTELLPILGMDEPLYYRNKVMTPYAPGPALDRHSRTRFARRDAYKRERATGYTKERHGRKKPQRREILCGMYAAGTHKIIPTDTCFLENQEAKRILLSIRRLMRKFCVEPYDEDAQTGFLRHGIVRVGHESGEVLVTLVTNGTEFPGSRNFARELVKLHPSITTVVQNINTHDTNAVLGHDGERVLYGPGFILDTLCGLSFRISAHSFYQVNATQTGVLYERAVELAQLRPSQKLLDAYCGTGTIGLVAAKYAPGVSVYGVDSVGSAIKDARENARHNGIKNAQFYTADAGDFMWELLAKNEKLDAVIMDPPRSGASEAFLDALVTFAPSRVVYISCNPHTQARDAQHLQDAGYELVAMQPVDMFPFTRHIENITCFMRAAR